MFYDEKFDNDASKVSKEPMEALERSNKNFEEWFVYQDCSAVSIPVQDNNNNNMASGNETLVNLVLENQNVST